MYFIKNIYIYMYVFGKNIILKWMTQITQWFSNSEPKFDPWGNSFLENKHQKKIPPTIYMQKK